MATIDWSTTKELTDSIGVQWDRLKTGLGYGTEANSVRKAANLNLSRIQTLAATDAQSAADMLQGFIFQLDRVTAGSVKSAELLTEAIRTIKSHIVNRGKSNTTFNTLPPSGERYSPSFAEVARLSGEMISPELVYAPVTLMGSFAVSGAGAGVFTDGAKIDDAAYGGVDIEARATSTATNIQITAVGIDVEGDNTNCTGTLNGASGTVVDLAAANGKKIMDVSNVTIEGGANGETFEVRSKIDRTPTE